MAQEEQERVERRQQIIDEVLALVGLEDHRRERAEDISTPAEASPRSRLELLRPSRSRDWRP